MLHSNDSDFFEFMDQVNRYADYTHESKVDLGKFVVHLYEFINDPN